VYFISEKVSRVRPSFLGFHRFMKELCDHTAGVQQPYEDSCLFGCIVMNSHNLIEPLVAGCLIGGAGGRSCFLVSGFSVTHLAGFLSSVGKTEIRCCAGKISYLRRMIA
jgi:hypothetical protein